MYQVAGRAMHDRLRTKLIDLRSRVNALCGMPRTEQSVEQAFQLLDELAEVTANAAGQLTDEQSNALATLTARVQTLIQRR